MLRERIRAVFGTRQPLGVEARQVAVSAVASLDDEPAQPSDRLLDVAEQAIVAARRVNLEALSDRIQSGPKWPSIWPGEHYKLLAALVTVTGARRVVEIGTYRGLSALALLSTLSPDGRLATFDIIPYDRIAGHVFRATDFADSRLSQIVADITTADDFARHRALLREAELIFVDAAKDGRQERVFLQRFDEVGFLNAPLIVFDDIRLYNMLQIWRDIRRPKLDLTSFGHWSGTGLVDYG
jgi:predicted O-methyltransferase YrrM